MCEALKDYGKAWGLTVEIGTGHYSDKFCPFSGGGDIYVFGRDGVAVIVNPDKEPIPTKGRGNKGSTSTEGAGNEGPAALGI